MNESNYDDIINLPHHISATRAHMSAHDRAAQFSPFAALTGYDAEIKETARLTDERRELDEAGTARIDSCLQALTDNADERPAVSVTYFVADGRKSGGSYVTASGAFRRLDENDRTLVFTNGTKIPIEDIYSLDGEIFRMLDMENPM